ncbi:hypothetical protein D3C72_674960 [compost metagenome]
MSGCGWLMEEVWWYYNVQGSENSVPYYLISSKRSVASNLLMMCSPIVTSKYLRYGR